MTTVLLVRHGETDWNRDRRLQGQTDVPLNDAGRAQAAALARELAGTEVDAVYSSDLARSLETARAIAEPHGLEVVTRAALRERHFGSWEGLTDEEIRARFPEAATGPWGDAETHEQLTERVLAALHEIAASHPGGVVVVVTHGGPMGRIWLACGGSPDERPRVGNCDVHEILVRNGSIHRIH